MKNVRTLAYLMAITMVSTVGFVSCKDKNAPEENKNQQTQQQLAEGDVVKTEFSISLPEQLADSRMPRRMPGGTIQAAGMTEFQGMTGITLLPFAKFSGAIVSGDTRLGSRILLAEDLDQSDVNGKDSQAKVFSDVNIPLTTASFLFYAKSKATGSKFNVGSLVLTPADLNDNPANISFALEPIMATPTSEYTAAHDALLTYLSSIAAANNGAGTPRAWYEITDGDDPAMAALFATFSTWHGLSSFEVQRVLTDLYKTLKPIQSSNTLAANIMTAIAAPANVTVNASDEVVLAGNFLGFPQDYNLPVGSVDIAWDGANHVFKDGLYNNMAALNTYVYPAQLWYYANSLIKTSNTSKKTMYDDPDNDWGEILAEHDDATAVNSLTRAVAIVNPVQYAVARLDVSVKLKQDELVDNSDNATGSAVNVDMTGKSFPVTAVLIGGQRAVNFDFSSKDDGTEMTIYDNVMTAGAGMLASTTKSSYNKTLVLQNKVNTDVRIAVEMQNNSGKDFFGYGNQLIPAGGKFYVVAELKANAATQTDNLVFKQDYTTIANLTLKDLRNAYNTIPDLRTPQLELGFSVDLEWQEGHTYDVEI